MDPRKTPPKNISLYDDKPSVSQTMSFGNKVFKIELYFLKDKSGNLPEIDFGLNIQMGLNGNLIPIINLTMGDATFSYKADDSNADNITLKIYEEFFGKDVRVHPPKPGDAGREFLVTKEIKHHSGEIVKFEFSNPEGHALEIVPTQYQWNTQVTIHYQDKYITHELRARPYTINAANLFNEDWELTRSTYADPKEYEKFVAPKASSASSTTEYSRYRVFTTEKKSEPIQSIGDYPLPEPAVLDKIFEKENFVKSVKFGNSSYGYSLTIDFHRSPRDFTVKNFIHDMQGAKFREDPYPQLLVDKDIESFTRFIRKYESEKAALQVSADVTSVGYRYRY